MKKKHMAKKHMAKKMKKPMEDAAPGSSRRRAEELIF